MESVLCQCTATRNGHETFEFYEHLARIVLSDKVLTFLYECFCAIYPNVYFRMFYLIIVYFKCRMIADPSFLYKLCIETAATTGSSIWWEVSNRGDRYQALLSKLNSS